MKEFWNTMQMVFAAVGGWLGYFLGGWYIVAGAAVCALVIWASMEQKQHRFWELMTGSAVSGVSFLCLALLI